MTEKIKMPLAYLSHSAWDLYRRDPLAFYQQYFVGRLDRPTLKMKLGKIFQEAWSDKAYDYAAELKKEGFTGDYERIIRTALQHPQTVKLPKSKCEKKHTVSGQGLLHPILAIYDGEEKDFLVENKFGYPWTRKMAEESTQLTWYSLVRYLETGKIPRILLQSFNSKNGIPTKFWVERSRLQIDYLIREINRTVENIQAGKFYKDIDI